jgi:hypothetical protein
MKRNYIILLVVVLLSGIGTVIFFVTKKKKDSKGSSSKVPSIEPKENTEIVKPETAVVASIPPKPLIKESLVMDIKVPHIDVGNRRFDYSMHYKGIPYKGNFEDGLTNTVHIKKSFGSFVIKQRMNREKGDFDVPVGRNTTKDQKIKSGTVNTLTKGGAAKGATASGVRPLSVNEISGITSLNSDWVDLFIADPQNRVLKQLSVNLRTGETTNANLKF